jgi:hypothetical protein
MAEHEDMVDGEGLGVVTSGPMDTGADAGAGPGGPVEDPPDPDEDVVHLGDPTGRPVP